MPFLNGHGRAVPSLSPPRTTVRKLINALTFLAVLTLSVALQPRTASACVFCLEHMGVDAAMFWTNDVMMSMRFDYASSWISGSAALSPNIRGINASQLLMTQENTLQVLASKRWMVQVTEPFYYRWNWSGATSGYSPGLGNNNPGFLAVPGDLWIANLLDLYDRNTFSGATRVILVQGVHFPTSPTLQTFNNQYINSDLTGAGAYELTFGLEAMHTFANGRWMIVGDFLNSFELPNNLGTETGDTINTDYMVAYRLNSLHTDFPETWISFGDYIHYNSANLQVNPITLNGQVIPAGPILGTEAFTEQVGVGGWIIPHNIPNLMVFANVIKYLYWDNPGSTPLAPNLFPTFKANIGFMWMF